MTLPHFLSRASLPVGALILGLTASAANGPQGRSTLEASPLPFHSCDHPQCGCAFDHNYVQCANPVPCYSHTTVVINNQHHGCCSYGGACAVDDCTYDISVTAYAYTGQTCCFYITRDTGSGHTCVAGDCNCVCTVAVPSLNYTLTGVTFSCGESHHYAVHECSQTGCLPGPTPDAIYEHLVHCHNC